MRSTIIFNGKSSDDFGLVVEYFPESVHAARRGELTPIPGRNGVIVREDGSFDSYVQTYQIWFRKTNENPRGTYANARAVADWLLNAREFQRLEDSYEPGFFRLARYSGSLNVETVLRNHGRATIQFDVQPQRYLKSGEVEIKTNTHNDREGIELSQAPFGAEKIAVRITAPSGTTLSGVTANFYKDGTLHPCTIRKQYETEDKVIFYGERDVVYGAAFFVSVDDNSIFDSVAVLQVVGDESKTIAVIGNSSPVIINPTQFESRPLLKFVDTSEEPAPVQQTITRVERTAIAPGGSVVAASALNYTCQPISVSGYAYAYVSGNSYAFYDNNGNAISFVDNYYKAKRTQMDNIQVIIPNGAATIIVGTFDDMPGVAVSLKAARPNPGASAVTINGTTISLDFSVHDTIFLDCDLHDAHYLDGSSANDKVSFSSTLDPYPTFPAFAPGENTVIVRDGDNLDFSIVPRWWEL